MDGTASKIVIAQSYSYLNKGDAGIVLGMIKDIRERFPEADITLVSQTPDIDSARYSDAYVIASPFRKVYDRENPVRKMYYFFIGFLAIIWGFLHRCVGEKLPCPGVLDIVSLYANGDAIVLAGGDKFYDYDTGIRSAIEGLPMVFEAALAIAVDSPLMIYGHSGGPFKNRYRRPLIKWIFKRAEVVTAREPISKRYFDELALSILTADAAFLAPDGEISAATRTLRKHDIDTNDQIIGMTVRKWYFPEAENSRQQMQRYQEGITEIIELMSKRGFQIILFPQVIGVHTDDRRISRAIASKTDAIALEGDYEVPHLREMIGMSDLFIGTRMHSNIFALSKQVPTLAIAYRHKTRGIMSMLGLGQYVVDIGEVNERSQDMVELLISDKHDIEEILKKEIPEMIRHARKNGDLLEDIL